MSTKGDEAFSDSLALLYPQFIIFYSISDTLTRNIPLSQRLLNLALSQGVSALHSFLSLRFNGITKHPFITDHRTSTPSFSSSFLDDSHLPSPQNALSIPLTPFTSQSSPPGPAATCHFWCERNNKNFHSFFPRVITRKRPQLHSPHEVVPCQARQP